MASILAQMHRNQIGPAQFRFHSGPNRIWLMALPSLAHRGNMIYIDSEFYHFLSLRRLSRSPGFGDLPYLSGLLSTPGILPSRQKIHIFMNPQSMSNGCW
jgi:hypothetical protein